MERRLPFLLFLTAAMGVVASAALASENESKEKKVVEIGVMVSNVLLKNLKSELVASIKVKGIEHAIGFCSNRALDLTESTRSNFPQVLKLKRASFQHRNTKNAPDGLEVKALRFFEEKFKKGESIPSHYLQKEKSGEVYQYFQPLVVESACLSCHGPRDSIAPNVLSAIDSRYPNDKAFGYGLGDLRGVVQVSILLDSKD